MSGPIEPLLAVKGLSSGYGPVTILREIDIEAAPGSVTALVGANGAGKTTLMKTIAGLIPAWTGEIRFDGQDITQAATHHRVDRGIVLVPEGRMVFALLSVEQNLRLGAIAPRARKNVSERLEEAFRRFPRLHERKAQLAGSMSGGEQQMLAIGRGLMAKPRIILLDEPTLGLAPIMVKQVFAVIEDLRKDGYTILLSEQNSRLALEIADYGYIIESGRVQLSGPGPELVDMPDVRRLYLGR
ncbi:ABC transporter ATP-binding protein [Mesorhizobium sp. YR577]|uniref:ABC transporter ATP-binding protein n=1 Tax=Mesorhizobium sp. YR577 TaxID=1884373 RepID=UPI0008E4F272|nr:ABC transporter ATP-binding protein [Mesorhizobium sp. YR577]SFU18909.1 amino acid/amide ABC transporter ATP-binding protein 2, HAAT family [Mesorhizobium sp. YR577]